ncbi:hypothetical protein Tco_0967050 [Tanacetum coccineum]
MTESRYTMNLNTSVSKENHYRILTTEVKLTEFEKSQNCDQLYAIEEHEVTANESRIMMERFVTNNDPLALVSDASVRSIQHKSSKYPNPQQSPYPSDTFNELRIVLQQKTLT